MPGVVVTTKASSGTGTPLTENSGQFFVAGLAERGVTNKAVLVRGIADFETEFGGRTNYSYLHDTIRTFFEEGGEQAYVSRVIGKAPKTATVSVVDTAVPAVNTIRFDAKSAGEWGNDYTIEIEDGATPNTVTISVVTDDKAVETFSNLATPDAIVAAFRGSAIVSAVNLGSASVAPTNLPDAGSYPLATGTDDRGSVDTASYKAALDNFVSGLGSGAVAIPGVGDSAHPVLISHAEKNRRIALLSAAKDATVTALGTLADSYDTAYAGLFAPWVNIADGFGGTRSVSPEGYVAACRARAHREVGPERAPAGKPAIARSIVSLVQNYTSDEGNALDARKVSVIRSINNTNRLYGWRSLSNDVVNWQFLNGADLMNYLVVLCEQELEQYVFATVDSKGQMLAAMHGTLVGTIEPVANRGGLYPLYDDAGEEIDPGFVVNTGSEVNSIANLKNNEVRARLGFRLAPVGTIISLTIVKASLTAGF